MSDDKLTDAEIRELMAQYEAVASAYGEPFKVYFSRSDPAGDWSISTATAVSKVWDDYASGMSALNAEYFAHAANAAPKLSAELLTCRSWDEWVQSGLWEVFDLLTPYKDEYPELLTARNLIMARLHLSREDAKAAAGRLEAEIQAGAAKTP